MDNSTKSSNLHVIFGTGPLGRATAIALFKAGQQVRLINRQGKLTEPPAGCEVVAGDLLNVDSAKEVARGASVIYFCAQPPYHLWTDQFPKLQNSIINISSRIGAKLVVAENLYGHGLVHGSMNEKTPLNPNSKKGHVRASMHKDLVKAHETGQIQMTVGRGSDFFGPWVTGSALGDRFFKAIAKGKPVEVLGDIDCKHSYTYVVDFGMALSILGMDSRSTGQVWNVPNAPVLSTREIIEMCFSKIEHKSKFRKLSTLELKVVGQFVPTVKELIEMLYEFEHDFIVDHQKFSNQFGDISTAFSESLSETLKWTVEQS